MMINEYHLTKYPPDYEGPKEFSAHSTTKAKLRAASIYKEQIKSPYPAGFLAYFFTARIIDPLPPGRKAMPPPYLLQDYLRSREGQEAQV